MSSLNHNPAAHNKNNVNLFKITVQPLKMVQQNKTLTDLIVLIKSFRSYCHTNLFHLTQ